MENNSYTYPIIPGYPIETIIILFGTVVGTLILIFKKKRVNRDFF